MARHVVCLSFDFDALSLWMARGMATPTPLSRGEFGAVGTERILALLDRFVIRATWFIPGHTIETFPELCGRICAAGHEIGNHGYVHEVPAALTRAQEKAVLRRGSAAIERLTGAPPRGYRSPSWDLSPHTIDLLLEQGFVYDSSLMGHDYLPYRCRVGDEIPPDGPARFGQPSRLIELPISWTLDDYPHFEFVRTPTAVMAGLRRAGDVLENWVDDFRYMVRTVDWGVLTYTFHPQVIGRGHRMLMLERLVETLQAEGAVFLPMEQAAAEYSARSPAS